MATHYSPPTMPFNFISPTSAYLTSLRALIEPPHVLEKHGYITSPQTSESLLLKRRCLGCNKREAMSQLVQKRTTIPTKPADEVVHTIEKMAVFDIELPSLLQDTLDGTASPPLSAAGHPPNVELVKQPTIRCKFHPGEIREKYWTCCAQHVTAKPCGGSSTHNPRDYAPGELTWLYQLHPTPRRPSRGSDIRLAVAIDCEMGMAISGDSELIRVTMIDYFTGEILVNNLVETDVPMRHLNTQYSGVTWADMRKAQRQNTCLHGKAGARNAIWRYVGPETVVVGHGASNDLRALRWIHGAVVDSVVTESIKRKEAEELKKAEAEAKNMDEGDLMVADPIEGGSLSSGSDANGGPKKKPLSLKSLVKERLHRDIQMGRSGHDSLEDAIAARDLVHWIVTNPDGVQPKTMSVERLPPVAVWNLLD